MKRTPTAIRSTLANAAAVAFLLALAACGGGGGGGTGIVVGTGGGTGGTGVSVASVSEGAMVVGSVIVNGVRFDDTQATVIVDDNTATRGALKDGMVVKVKGRIADDRVTGTAERVEVENEVRGTVQSVSASTSPRFFTVVNQKVLVDDLTVFANTASDLSGLVGGSSFVEVHGQRDAAGNIRATRVEAFGGSGLGDELRGRIATLGTNTLTINNGTVVTVTFSAGVIQPASTALAVGQLIEVHGSFSAGTFIATRLDVEDAEDSAFRPDSGGRFEVEGFVTGFTATPGTFSVNGRSVQTTSATRFEGGSAADLANGAKVEAEGTLSGSTIVAEKIAFKRVRHILHGTATAVNGGARTITVLGVTARVDDLTDVRPRAGSGLAAIPVSAKVEVRGYLESGGTFVAERIDELSGGGGDDFVQGRVTAKAGTSLTVLGIVGSVAGASQFQDANGNAINQQAFLAAVTASATNGTLVKLKGAFSPGLLTVTEAELEN
jgi:hypothetical protein